MNKLKDIEAIVFDADDTLWDCQSHFEAVELRYCELLTEWCDAEEAATALFNTERSNMPLLGYGSKAFTISVIESALRMSKGKISQASLEELIQMGKQLLLMPCTPLLGVIETLSKLQGYKLVLLTKGELQEQENKIKRSGLEHYFSHIEIVSNKDESTFRQLSDKLGVDAERMLSVGNSFKSDIAPALSAGYHAIHIPFHVVWELEQTDEFEHERLRRIERFEEIERIMKTAKLMSEGE
jgi:putative hydrolase of the HAD superfamily